MNDTIQSPLSYGRLGAYLLNLFLLGFTLEYAKFNKEAEMSRVINKLGSKYFEEQVFKIYDEKIEQSGIGYELDMVQENEPLAETLLFESVAIASEVVQEIVTFYK